MYILEDFLRRQSPRGKRRRPGGSLLRKKRMRKKRAKYDHWCELATQKLVQTLGAYIKAQLQQEPILKKLLPVQRMIENEESLLQNIGDKPIVIPDASRVRGKSADLLEIDYPGGLPDDV